MYDVRHAPTVLSSRHEFRELECVGRWMGGWVIYDAGMVVDDGVEHKK